jgi:hypothetical protein
LVRARHGHLGRISAFAIGEPDGPIPRQYRCVEPRRATGFKLNGAAAYDFSGYSVASAGDVNGDGFADVIVGANGADSHSSGSGASFAANIDLSTLDGATGFKLSGAADSDFVGG